MRALLIPCALLLVGWGAACACTKPSSKAATVTSDPYAACENAARLGCPFGQGAQCGSALGAAVVEGHTTADAIACAESASTKAAIVACDPSYFRCP